MLYGWFALQSPLAELDRNRVGGRPIRMAAAKKDYREPPDIVHVSESSLEDSEDREEARRRKKVRVVASQMALAWQLGTWLGKAAADNPASNCSQSSPVRALVRQALTARRLALHLLTS